MGSKIYRADTGATVADFLGAASKAPAEPFCSNPKCQFHVRRVPAGTEAIEVVKPGLVIGSVRRELVKRSAFVSEVNDRRAYFCEVCELAIDSAYAVMSGGEMPAAPSAVEPAPQPDEKRRHDDVIDRKFQIEAVNPVNGNRYTEANALLLCAKDKAVPAALFAYKLECERIGAKREHIRSVELLYNRVKDFQAVMGGGRVPDTVGEEVPRCLREEMQNLPES